jgi:hypothetical protein
VTQKPSESPISADALARLAPDVLDTVASAETEELRYWAYTPLLIGLCGTVVGLLSLLRSNPDDMQQHLGGVLFGTLSGVAVTLISSTMVSMVGSSAESAKRAALGFTYSCLVPAIPERKIAVSIERALLDEIEARSRAIVETFRAGLLPVATSLELSAKESGRAAELAAGAFASALDAVKRAPALLPVLTQIANASKHTEKAAVLLTENAVTLGGLIRQEEVTVNQVRDSSGTLGLASEGLIRSVKNLQEGISGSPSSLASSILGIAETSKELETEVGKIHSKVSDLNQELIGLGDEVSKLGNRQVTALRDDVTQQVGELVKVVSDHLEQTPGRTALALMNLATKSELLLKEFSALEAQITATRTVIPASVTHSDLPTPEPTPPAGSQAGMDVPWARHQEAFNEHLRVTLQPLARSISELSRVMDGMGNSRKHSRRRTLLDRLLRRV